MASRFYDNYHSLCSQKKDVLFDKRFENIAIHHTPGTELLSDDGVDCTYVHFNGVENYFLKIPLKKTQAD